MVKTLKKLHYPARMGEVTIVNLVAKINMKFPIATTRIAHDALHKRYCVSQGKKFHCLNYRIKTIQPQITVRIFSNGCVLFQSTECVFNDFLMSIKGAKKLSELYDAVRLMVPVFHQYRRVQYQPIDPMDVFKYFKDVEQYE